MRGITFLILFLISTISANTILPIAETEQRHNQWCWSGCSTPILNYYGESVSQGEIVQYAYGDSSVNQWNWLNGHAAVQYNGRTYYPHGINEIMDHWNTPNRYGMYKLTQSQWKAEIDGGHPFVIRWGWNSGGGHFVVGMGYLNNGQYQIMDPWYGNGYTVSSYNNVAYPNNGRWTHSLTTDRTPLNGDRKYRLTVNGGSGSGEYRKEAQVPVTAKDSAGYTFQAWTGDVQVLGSALSQSTVVTMPNSAASITATYRLNNNNNNNLALVSQNDFSVESSSSEWGYGYGNSKILDGKNSTFWHSASGRSLPANVVFKLNNRYLLGAVEYLPRQDGQNGRVKGYRVEVSVDGYSWNEVGNGEFSNTGDKSPVDLTGTEPVQFVRFIMTSTYSSDGRSVSIADFNLYKKEVPFSVESSSSQWAYNYGNNQILDGKNATFWHSAEGTLLPADIVFKINGTYSLNGFSYLPRQDREMGSVKNYRLEVSADGTNWSEVKSGVLPNSKSRSSVISAVIQPVSFVKFIMLSSHVGNNRVSVADFGLTLISE